MDPFSYLSVLISIVLGLAIAHLLGAIVRIIHNRERTIVYWPSLVYAVVLLVLIVQVWWADYHMQPYRSWTFAGFASTLLIPAGLYLACGLLLPSGEYTGTGTDDMRASFFHNKTWFLGTAAALPLFSFVQELLVDGHISSTADSTMKLLFVAVLVGSMLAQSERVLKALTIVGAGLMLAYVAVLFNTLR